MPHPKTDEPLVRKVLLFAGLRERAGAESIEVQMPRDATVGELLVQITNDHPELRDPIGLCRVAVDHEFVASTHRLGNAEEIALIPPVSGGQDRYLLTTQPLSLDDVIRAVEHPGAGGVATFTGNVRSRSRGHAIQYLEYEAYAPMARKALRAIGERIERDAPGTRVAIHHRLGHLDVGESAVVIAASAPHRAEAFAACREAIEQLKKDVPIWKREVSRNGAQWLDRGP
jgi:molybdopterin synthase catalytic subunit